MFYLNGALRYFYLLIAGIAVIVSNDRAGTLALFVTLLVYLPFLFGLFRYCLFLAVIICIFIILFNYGMIPTRLILLTELVTAILKDLTFDGLISAMNVPKFSVNIYFEKWVAISSGWFGSQKFIHVVIWNRLWCNP